METWVNRLVVLGLGLLLPLNAPATTIPPVAVGPVVEQVIYIYDVCSITVNSASTPPLVDTSGQPVPFFGQFTGFHAAKRVAAINPVEIRFSQASESDVEQIAASMRANGWQGAPIDVVRMSDGALTTLDNTRTGSAQ